MRAMRSEGKLYLHKHFMGIKVFRISRKSVLAANLCEFAGPVGQNQRATFVRQSSIGGAVGIVVPAAKEPATGKLIIGGTIKPKSPLEPRSRWRRAREAYHARLVLLPPDEFATRDKGTINGALQRFPPVCGVYSVKICNEVAAKLVVTARIR